MHLGRRDCYQTLPQKHQMGWVDEPLPQTQQNRHSLPAICLVQWGFSLTLFPYTPHSQSYPYPNVTAHAPIGAIKRNQLYFYLQTRSSSGVTTDRLQIAHILREGWSGGRMRLPTSPLDERIRPHQLNEIDQVSHRSHQKTLRHIVYLRAYQDLLD